MVHAGRIGEKWRIAFRAGLGLSLLLAISGALPAVERSAHSGVLAGGRGRDSYLLTRGEHGLSTNLSVEEFVELHEMFSGEFLWVRRGGRRFLIRDRARLSPCSGRSGRSSPSGKLSRPGNEISQMRNLPSNASRRRSIGRRRSSKTTTAKTPPRPAEISNGG